MRNRVNGKIVVQISSSLYHYTIEDVLYPKEK
jgi:hypothetical protein